MTNSAEFRPFPDLPHRPIVDQTPGRPSVRLEARGVQYQSLEFLTLISRASALLGGRILEVGMYTPGPSISQVTDAGVKAASRVPSTVGGLLQAARRCGGI